MIRRPIVVFMVVAMMGAGCADSEPVSTVSVPSSVPDATTASSATPTTVAEVTTSTVASTTTSTESSTTSTASDLSPASLLIANADGVFLADPGFLTQLVTGPVWLAVDDGAGGVVFQRFTDSTALEATDTIIEYLPPDSTEPRDLLVPTGQQYLELWDVADGRVWYSRREGDTPETVAETLRTYDLATRTVEELGQTGGWESGSIQVSVAGDRVVAFWGAEATTGFQFYDRAGRFVTVEGDPYEGRGFCSDGSGVFDADTGEQMGDRCFEFAELSDRRLAYYERFFDGTQVRYVLVVVDIDRGDELLRLDLDRPDQGWVPRELDLRGRHVIVNRTDFSANEPVYLEALMVDVTTGSVEEVDVPGQARFLKGPMAIP